MRRRKDSPVGCGIKRVGILWGLKRGGQHLASVLPGYLRATEGL